jgi:hypothetical protein
MTIEKKIDWNFLRKLRGLYVISAGMLQKDYWASTKNLEDYDVTLGERIRWKWQWLLGILDERSFFKEVYWARENVNVLDWGCGSGQALAEFQEWMPQLETSNRFVFDRSEMAMKFSIDKCGAKKWNQEPINVLLLSHVCSELSEESQNALFKLLKKSDVVIWVEAGSSYVSRKLSTIRNEFLEVGNHEVIFPCPHQEVCPLTQHKTDWCHSFAKTPSTAHQDPFWAKAREELQIDLGQLPTQAMVFVRKGIFSPEQKMSEYSFGTPIMTKHDASVLTCTSAGEVVTKKISKSKNPAEFKRLKKQ